jgi:hypothetical protein
MKSIYWLGLAALLIGSFVTGCNQSPAEKPSVAQKVEEPDSEDAGIEANLANLSPEDRRLAEEQKFCAIESENRLGVMGTPIKIMMKDQPVFLCCKGCRKKALADPDRTLAKVKELKSGGSGSASK